MVFMRRDIGGDLFQSGRSRSHGPDGAIRPAVAVPKRAQPGPSRPISRQSRPPAALSRSGAERPTSAASDPAIPPSRPAWSPLNPDIAPPYPTRPLLNPTKRVRNPTLRSRNPALAGEIPARGRLRIVGYGVYSLIPAPEFPVMRMNIPCSAPVSLARKTRLTL